MKRILSFLILVLFFVGDGTYLSGCAEKSENCESCKRVHPEYFKNDGPIVDNASVQ